MNKEDLLTQEEDTLSLPSPPEESYLASEELTLAETTPKSSQEERDFLSPTLNMIPSEKLPKEDGACQHCPGAIWFYRNESLTCYCLPIAADMRKEGIRTEVYPDKSKMKKQMSYANAMNIPFVALAGDNEIQQGKITLKNMTTGEQSLVSPQEMIRVIKEAL